MLAAVVDEQHPERPPRAAEAHGDIGADAEALDVGLLRPPHLVGQDVHGRPGTDGEPADPEDVDPEDVDPESGELLTTAGRREPAPEGVPTA